MARAVVSWLNHLEVERGAARNTIASYRRDLERYQGFLAERGVTEPRQVTQADVSDFLASLREGSPGRRPLSATSAARTIVAVRGLHRFLALEGEVPTDPAVDVAPPRPPSRLPKA
ncbi:MAG: site-specific integrase, partial [Actinomycetota bacterium]|nr:site-specific integrase [Actinomycetota bacterium]